MQLRLSLRFLFSDIKSGELHLLWAAVTVAVMIVTSIALFSERLQKALVAESSAFLAADLVLQSPEVVPESWLKNPAAIQMRQAQVVEFPSMVFYGEEMTLASVKAVSATYPLLGNLEISTEAFADGIQVEGGPKTGEAWLDSRLLILLGVKQGDEIFIGEKSFIVKQILAREPDGGSSYWSLGPRILISLQDLPDTQVVQAGSRVEYRYLFAGREEEIQQYREWLLPQLQKRYRLLSLEDSQPGLAQSLKRAESFLLLAGSLGVLLAAIAIAMAARRYSVRHFDTVAILKVLGMSSSVMKGVMCLPLVCVALTGILSGWILGAVIQHAFLTVMQEWLPAVLPPSSWRPYGVGAVTGLLCVLVFALPILWSLLAVPPLRVLRRELEGSVLPQSVFYVLGALAIYGLMVFFSGQFQLASILFVGTLGVAGFAAGWAVLLLRGVRVVGSQAGSLWRLALANLRRHSQQSVLQLVIFSLVFMLLLISLQVRTSLLKEWQQQLPAGTPNQFLINIGPYEVEAVRTLLADHLMEHQNLHPSAGDGFVLYPMVRGRLTAINGVEATTQISEEVDELYRELNLSWSATLPEDNVLTAGAWWTTPAQSTSPRVSIEQSLAEKLRVKVGDHLEFTIGNEKVQVQIASIRSLDWDRMRPNFYFLFEPWVLDHFAATYITSFYLPPEQKSFLVHLLKQFPTISVFSVDEMIRRIQRMVLQVTQAIELVLLMILVAGLLVLVATLQASLDQRLRESALLRSLGAKRAVVLGSFTMEFLALGALAGLMAASGSTLATAWLQTQVFDMELVFYGGHWLWGPLVGMLVVGVTGVLACAKVVRVPPLRLLQE